MPGCGSRFLCPSDMFAFNPNEKGGPFRSAFRTGTVIRIRRSFVELPDTVSTLIIPGHHSRKNAETQYLKQG